MAHAEKMDRQEMAKNPRQTVLRFLALVNSLRSLTDHSPLDLDLRKVEKSFKTMLQFTNDQNVTLRKLVVIYACLMKLDEDNPIEEVPYAEGTKTWVEDRLGGSHFRKATYAFTSFFNNLGDIRNLLMRFRLTKLSDVLEGYGVA